MLAKFNITIKSARHSQLVVNLGVKIGLTNKPPTCLPAKYFSVRVIF